MTRLEAKVEYDINCFANRMSYGLKKQISKLNPKMGYFGGPNKALTNMRFKDQVGLMFWEEEEPYGRRGRGRREEEDEGAKLKQAKKVWKLTLIMNPMRFGMDL